MLAILKFLLASDVLGSSLFEISSVEKTNEINITEVAKMACLSRNEVIKVIFYE